MCRGPAANSGRGCQVQTAQGHTGNELKRLGLVMPSSDGELRVVLNQFGGRAQCAWDRNQPLRVDVDRRFNGRATQRETAELDPAQLVNLPGQPEGTYFFRRRRSRRGWAFGTCASRQNHPASRAL